MLFGAAWIGEVIALVTWWMASSVSLWPAALFAATTTLVLLYSWATK